METRREFSGPDGKRYVSLRYDSPAEGQDAMDAAVRRFNDLVPEPTMPNADPTPGPVSEADLRVIADKMGAFGIDIENVTLTSAGLDVDGPHRVTTIADLASALLAAREALRFYAKPENYGDRSGWRKAPPVIQDGGGIARVALGADRLP